MKKKKQPDGTKELFRALSDPDTLNRWRIQGKISLSRLAYSLILLFAADTIITATTKTLLHPAVAIVGLIWILLVTAVIWFRGGIVVDALFGAEIINLEVKHTEKHFKTGEGFRPGHDFVQALALLGMISVFITSFFLFVPIWQSWGFFLALLIILIGWRCAATLAESKFDWNKVRVAYIVFTVCAVGIIFLVYGHEFMTGQELTLKTAREGLQEGIGKQIFWPILLIIVGSFPKVPLRGLIKFVGVVYLLIILFTTFLMPVAEKKLAELKKFKPAPRAQAAPVPKKEAVVEMACVTVVVPAHKVIDTHFWHNPRERIQFHRIARGSCDPNIASYYVHGDGDFNLPVYSEWHSCQYPVGDTVRLKGGPVTTMVSLSK